VGKLIFRNSLISFKQAGDVSDYENRRKAHSIGVGDDKSSISHNKSVINSVSSYIETNDDLL
jgi:hypothetical protein